MRPALKIGSSILGTKFHIPLAGLNKRDKSALLPDSELVKVIDGKKAARAAPILAFAARKPCSASKMSGRCSRICEESAGGKATPLISRRLLAASSGRCW
ncbi:Uncharacterised protein [Raoultella ornithinolytica]|nr:Uncharacterised protein [Raoultella ornithinolytica]